MNSTKVAANGINLHVRQSGSGEHALVFMHFWGGSSQQWTPIAQALAKQYRCVAPDARGTGDSDAPASGYSINDLADDVLGIVAALGLKSYLLVGHSMGGKTAQVIASRRPAGLKGIALVASSPAIPMNIPPEAREQMEGAYASAESINFVLDNVLTSSPVSVADREMLVASALRTTPAARKGWMEVGTREDYSKAIENVTVPVVVIAGEDDQVDPMEVVKAHIVPSFRGCEAHFLKSKGHLLPIEAPNELVSILGQFAARAFS